MQPDKGVGQILPVIPGDYATACTRHRGDQGRRHSGVQGIRHCLKIKVFRQSYAVATDHNSDPNSSLNPNYNQL